MGPVHREVAPALVASGHGILSADEPDHLEEASHEGSVERHGHRRK
jgi:hypothetical protein